MTAFKDVNKGDTVEVTYRGKIEQKSSAGFRIGGFWHACPDLADNSISIEVIEKALEVGWHRVVNRISAYPEAVVARYWNGQTWLYSEDLNLGAVRGYWESVGFLGGGPDE